MRDDGFVDEGRVIAGTVDRVTKAGVFVDVAAPHGTYRALLKRGEATGGDAAPTVAFLRDRFPAGSALRAEVIEVVVSGGDSALLVSTRALEASPGELADDREAFDARAEAREAAQGAPAPRAVKTG